jgi:hypothetical protein
VKVRERDNDLFLLVADGAKVSAQISRSRARVNDGDAVRIGEGDLQARGVAAELLKTTIADGDGSPRNKTSASSNCFHERNSRLASIKLAPLSAGRAFSMRREAITASLSRDTHDVR